VRLIETDTKMERGFASERQGKGRKRYEGQQEIPHAAVICNALLKTT